VTRAMPALVVGLTALVTSVLVNAGYGLWWLSQHLSRAHGAAAYDWAGALAVSGTATTVVLIGALIARRLVAGNASASSTEHDEPSRCTAAARAGDEASQCAQAAVAGNVRTLGPAQRAAVVQGRDDYMA
jgi:hypothetical protein